MQPTVSTSHAARLWAPAGIRRNDEHPELLAPHAPKVTAAIVGGGACGLTAALVLAEAGVECLLFERDEVPSGSTALSSGFVPAAGTRAQMRQGIEDSATGFAQDIQHKAGHDAAAHLVKAYTEAIGPAIDFLEDRGLAWEVLDDFLYPGHRTARMHCLPQRSGAALMAALLQCAEDRQVPLLRQALVRELIVDDQRRVHGLRLQRPDGRWESLACEAVLLACNGFGGNPELRARLLPELAHAPFAGHAGNDGSAIHWGEALGAGLADLSACQGHGNWAVPHGVLISWALMVHGGIQVNALGCRFHDESQGYSEAAIPVLAQPGGIAWCVFDDPILAQARGFPDFRQAEQLGAIRTAPDVGALAQLITCDTRALAHTLQELHPPPRGTASAERSQEPCCRPSMPCG